MMSDFAIQIAVTIESVKDEADGEETGDDGDGEVL